MGVLWGAVVGTGNGLFVPIERIYAESLLKGYDWSPEELRPVPVLDGKYERLSLGADRSTIEAEFDMMDFSRSDAGMVYEAALHRNGALVTITGGADYTKKVSRDTDGGSPGNIARFDVSSIPAAQRNGEFTVKVRLCPFTIGTSPSKDHCGGYGPAGSRSFRFLPPAPQNFKVGTVAKTSVQVSWDHVSGIRGYAFNRRVKGTSEWKDKGELEGKSRGMFTKLTCGTTYEFTVQAYGDGVMYDGKLGPSSAVAEATTSACSGGDTVGQSDAGGPLVRWTAAPDADHYVIEIPAKGLFFEVAGDRSSLRVPSATVAGMQTHQMARVWSCNASGLCGLHQDTWLPVRPPPSPKNLTATVTNEKVTLSWDAPDDPTVTGYQILRRRPDHGEDRMLVHVSDTGSVQTEFVDTAVQPGTRYEYRVKAINGAGIGRRSNSAQITTGPSP